MVVVEVVVPQLDDVGHVGSVGQIGEEEQPQGVEQPFLVLWVIQFISLLVLGLSFIKEFIQLGHLLHVEIPFLALTLAVDILDSLEQVHLVVQQHTHRGARRTTTRNALR